MATDTIKPVCWWWHLSSLFWLLWDTAANILMHVFSWPSAHIAVKLTELWGYRVYGRLALWVTMVSDAPGSLRKLLKCTSLVHTSGSPDSLGKGRDASMHRSDIFQVMSDCWCYQGRSHTSTAFVQQRLMGSFLKHFQANLGSQHRCAKKSSPLLDICFYLQNVFYHRLEVRCLGLCFKSHFQGG